MPGGTPAPAEFRGRARLLRQKIAANDVVLTRTFRELHDLFMPELRHGGTLSPTTITRARIIWRRLPEGFGEAKVRSTRHAFSVDGAWLVSGHYRNGAWDAGAEEAGILVVTVRMIANKHGVQVDIDPLLSLGVHALARWFERAPTTTEPALRAELVALLSATGKCPWRGAEGLWLGVDEQVRINERMVPVRLARTFIPASMAHSDQRAAA
jgi:hypothetical protein